jgi:MYXO-CTERM domain-containing protein
VVWASNRTGGRHEIYLMKSDGTGVKQLTYKGGKLPGWSKDGKWIAYTYSPDESTHVMSWDGTGDKQVCNLKFRFWMHDGSGLVCGDGSTSDSYYLVDPGAGTKKLLFKRTDFSHLKGSSTSFYPGAITHDGRWLLGGTGLYRYSYKGDNGTFKAYWSAVILDFKDKSKIYFFGEGCEPYAPPAGNLLYHVCGHKNTAICYYPDIFKMTTSDITKTPPSNDVTKRTWYTAEVSHKDADWGHEYFPRVSTDNTWLTYGASTGCHDHNTCDYEIFVHKLGAGSSDRTRLTKHSKNDQWPHMFVGTLPGSCTTSSQCDDKDPCTSDSCSGGKCSNTAIKGCCTKASQCADGDVCTKDLCSANKCANPKITGCCTKDAQCDDGSSCTKDTCDLTSNVCKYAPISGCCSSDADCADTNVCTKDSCDTSTGTCSNAAISGCCAFDTDCDDGDACTDDSCDTSSHTCEHVTSGACEPDGGATDGGAADGGPADAPGGGVHRQAEVLVGGCAVAAAEAPAPWLPLLLLALALVSWRRSERSF